MKVTVPEISFHNRDPILSVDVQHNSPDGITRMATGGTDTHVVIWQVTPLPSGGVSVEALCDLIRHNRAVNAVRFSPDGTLLVSADDEAAVIVWKCQDASAAAPDLFADDSEDKNKETWTIHKMLRGHIEDVYDLSWSRCSAYLISGSIDNSAIMWDVAKGKNIGLLKDHKNFVQGVAWDPLGQYIATLSSDRVLRWFSISNKRVLHKAYKATLPRITEDGTVQQVSTRLFHDDTLKSFCRRLSFSPDGLLLAAPSGLLAEEEHHCNAVHIFTRLSPTRPVLYLPTKDKPTLAVRFCPLLYKLRGSETKRIQSVFALPYRMVLAVACQNSVVLCDTQQLLPFARMSNMHYTRLTDLAWSDDGRILAISSTDGYCSLTYFSEGELGEEYVPPKKNEEETKTQTPAKAVIEFAVVTPQTHVKKPPSTAKMTKSDIKKKEASSNKTGNASIDKMILNQIAKSKQQALNAANDDSNDCVFICEHTPGKNAAVTDTSEITAVSDASKTMTFSAASKTTAVSALSKTTAVTAAASVSTKPNILVARRAPKSIASQFEPKATQPENIDKKHTVTDENTAKADSPKPVSHACDANKSKTEAKETVQNDDEEEELNDLVSASGEIDSDASESIGSRDSEEEDDDDASMASFGNKDDEDDMGVTEIDHNDDSCEIMEVDRVSSAQEEAHLTEQEFSIGRRIQASSAVCDNLSLGKTSSANESESNDRHKLNAKEVKNREITGSGASKENVNVDEKSSVNVNVKAVNRKPDSRPPRRVPLISLPRPGTATTPAASVAAPQATALLAPTTAVIRPSETSPLDCLIENTSDLYLKLDGDITMSSPLKTSVAASSSDKSVIDTSGNTVTLCTSTPRTPSAPNTPSASGPSSDPGTPSTAKAHRRISLITLASPKAKKALASVPETLTSK